ncbi:N-acetylmuramoyl-L-alanine amidase [Actinomadura craniellae]|uniref:N-acetylmuramoyl-L-alanine amidase n=1 Tax=Actinomadura craniellae TaxID=2231787 RepID=UPI001F301B16|nr:N-acetylmuramoyl-L-alanine amidase [Actinomadura craniellae]
MIYGRKFATGLTALALGALTACNGAPSPGGSPVGGGGGARPPTAAADGPSRASRNLPNDRSLRGKVIVVDPGHNGGNGGNPSYINRQVDVINGRKACDTTGTATASGYSEAAFNWDVSTRLVKELRARGARVLLTRTNNTGVGPCITERAAIGNRAKADAAVSVHADGARPSARGFHIIQPGRLRGHNDKIIAPSARLGRALRDAYRAGTGVPYSNYLGANAIDTRTDLGGLNLSTVPKVFIECGNMKNPGEAAKFTDPKFRQRVADSLADGFTAYFNG